MNTTPLRTAVIGFGRIGAGYADDPVMARHYRYATHAQVLKAHPAFAWEAVVDVSEEARRAARDAWGIRHVFASVGELAKACDPEVVVLATPPERRWECVEALPGLRGILVEKPVGTTPEDARRFEEVCARRSLAVQVNYWRRCDPVFRSLAEGGLVEHIGRVQAATGLYGNGLRNNGSHMIDFVRMLLGEVVVVQALGAERDYRKALPDDLHVGFCLRLADGLEVVMEPVDFAHYRENSLDLWGDRGRLAIMQEGLGIHRYPRVENRAMQGEREIASDRPEAIASSVGEALYHVYDNLAEALRNRAPLRSPIRSAIVTERVVAAVARSARESGRAIEVSGGD